MQVLMSLRTNNHHNKQLTVNDLTERKPFSRYRFGRNTKLKKCKITNIIINDTGMFNGQVITLSNFPFNFDTILFINLRNI